MMKVLVLGSGGHARSVASVIIEEHAYEICAFIDVQGTPELEEKIAGTSVVAKNSDLVSQVLSYACDAVYLAIGDQKIREQIYCELKGKVKMPNLFSKSAVIKKSTIFGDANIVLPLAHVGPDSKIGNNNIFNTGSIVEHECVIGNSNHLAPRSVLLGRVSIGDQNFIGSGAVVKPSIHLKNEITLGALSFANHHLNESGTYVGLPAAKVIYS